MTNPSPATLDLIRSAYARCERTEDTAAALGVTRKVLMRWRRLAGIVVGPGRPFIDRMDAIDDTTPGCPRCGLRSEHICLSGSATARRSA